MQQLRARKQVFLISPAVQYEPRTVAYNIARGLPDAVRRLRRDGPRILIVHGTVAERDTLAPPGLHDAYPECPRKF